MFESFDLSLQQFDGSSGLLQLMTVLLLFAFCLLQLALPVFSTFAQLPLVQFLFLGLILLLLDRPAQLFGQLSLKIVGELLQFPALLFCGI